MSETGKLSKPAGRMINARKKGSDLADTFLQVNKCLVAAWEGMRRHFIKGQELKTIQKDLY